MAWRVTMFDLILWSLLEGSQLDTPWGIVFQFLEVPVQSSQPGCQIPQSYLLQIPTADVNGPLASQFIKRI